MAVTFLAPGVSWGGGGGEGQARVQDGVLPVTQIPPLYFWRTKNQRSGQIDHLFFTQVGLLQLQHDYSLCSLCFSRDLTAGDGRYADRS